MSFIDRAQDALTLPFRRDFHAITSPAVLPDKAVDLVYAFCRNAAAGFSAVAAYSGTKNIPFALATFAAADVGLAMIERAIENGIENGDAETPVAVQSSPLNLNL